jgi:ADP-ribose pyrophosphatase YjhB (NUDIX family)
VGERITPVALALIRKDDEILVEEARDEVKNETFFRLLGGEIEFGEKGAEAVRRELREELGAESEVNRLFATLENVFTYEGEPSHEIDLIYECSLRDDRLYLLDEWEARETREGFVYTHKVAWKHLDSFRSGSEILYPEELLTLFGDQWNHPGPSLSRC